MTLNYDEVDPQFLVSLLAREVEESDRSVFAAAYKAGGFCVSEELVDRGYQRYMLSQFVPEQVADFCRKVLKGQAPYVGSKACYLLA